MIYELHYDNTNTYVISGKCTNLMFDTGWAGTFSKMGKALKMNELTLKDINYLLISHFHPDHMGIAGELQEAGVTILIMENQVSHLHDADYVFEREQRVPFVPVKDEEVKILSFAESRTFLKEMGIAGEIIPTPGHSEDSVSLWKDTGEVFVGDLYPLYELELHTEPEVQESWKKILSLKPHTVFYGHAKKAELREAENQRNDRESSMLQETDKELYKTVKKIMNYIDRGMSIEKIAVKLDIDTVFVNDVCRMYLTHKNVGVQGILDRIELKGK